jgi:hypothetical protein
MDIARLGSAIKSQQAVGNGGRRAYYRAMITVHGPARRKVTQALGALLALPLLTIAGWLTWYWFTYQTFAWSQPPSRLHYCGRDFGEGYHTPTLPTGSYTFTPAFTVEPAGWQVYTEKPSKSDITPPLSGPPLPCTMALVLRQSDHSYISYGLLGGP